MSPAKESHAPAVRDAANLDGREPHEFPRIMTGENPEVSCPMLKHLRDDYLTADGCDLSGMRDEDGIIVRLFLWIRSTAENTADGDIIRDGIRLVSHQNRSMCTTVAFAGADYMHLWKLADGRSAVSLSEDGPFAILPSDMSVFEVPGWMGERLLVFRFDC